jgi:uncharacterized protein YecE (DUF72 family)
MKGRDETPDGFVFAVKASRYGTNRKVLADMGESMGRFPGQGLTAPGDKLGPINWQFMGTRTFDPEDFEAFRNLLPQEQDGVRLRHAVEVRHPSFDTQQVYDLAAKYGVAIVHAVDDESPDRPCINQPTVDLTHARLMSSREDEPTGLTAAELEAIAAQTRAWAERGDGFACFSSGARVRNPAAAQALIRKPG